MNRKGLWFTIGSFSMPGGQSASDSLLPSLPTSCLMILEDQALSDSINATVKDNFVLLGDSRAQFPQLDCHPQSEVRISVHGQTMCRIQVSATNDCSLNWIMF